MITVLEVRGADTERILSQVNRFLINKGCHPVPVYPPQSWVNLPKQIRGPYVVNFSRLHDGRYCVNIQTQKSTAQITRDVSRGKPVSSSEMGRLARSPQGQVLLRTITGH